MVAMLAEIFSPTHAARFVLEVGALRGRALDVVRFDGEEAMSEPFSYRVEVLTDLPFDVAEPLVFGQLAQLIVHGEHGTRRVVRGVVRAVTSRDGVFHRGGTGARTRMTIEIVPRFAMLRECRRNRIFQDQTVQQIVSSILAEWGVEARWMLTDRHAAWPYCVQYEESDYDFVLRLLSGEGIFFFFSFESLLDSSLVTAMETVADALSSETMIFGDSTQSYWEAGAIEGVVRALSTLPPLRVVPDGSDLGNGAEHITSFGVRRTLAPRSVVLRDYRPINALHVPRGAARVDSSMPSSLSSAVDLARDALQEGLAATNGIRFDDRLAEVYEHAPQRAPGGDVSGDGAKRALEQYRSTHVIADGASNAPRLIPGHLFFVDDHSVSSLDGGYVVTKLRSTGITPELSASSNDGGARPVVYRNDLEATPHDLCFRPLREPRPSRQTLETAVVVGPPHEEIYTDSLGRIKVRFHWDVGGSENESRSCWIRVAQSWSGPGFGTHFTPRVGMEVLVSFVGGDVDRPIVIGCVPNSSNPPLVTLPRDKTRSGIRTRSSPDASGYNELTFEDARGAEQIRLRAERDLDMHVQHDRTTSIGRNDDTTVHDDTRLDVGRDRAVSIRRHDRLEISGSQELSVRGDRSVAIDGRDERRVRGHGVTTIEGNETRRVDGAATIDVIGDARLHVGGDLHGVVLGTERTAVHGETHRIVERTAIGEMRGCTVVSVGTPTEQRALVAHVEGEARCESTADLVLSSEKSILLRCGKSSILIGPESIQIATPKLMLEGKAIQTFGESFHVVASETAHLKAEGVFLTGATGKMSLHGDVKIGPTVDLGVTPEEDASPSRATAQATAATIHLRDDHGRDVPHQAFVLRAEDGTERAGVLDHEGRAEVLGLSGSWTVEFPMLAHVAEGTP